MTLADSIGRVLAKLTVEDVRMLKGLDPMHIVITGNVGVGKTTTARIIKGVLEIIGVKTGYVEEFISYMREDAAIGEIMFRMHQTGIITSLTLQSFILDLLKLSFKKRGDTVTVYERLPEDSVYGFAYSLYKKGNLTKEEFEVLEDKVLHDRLMSKERYSKYVIVKIENKNAEDTVVQMLKQLVTVNKKRICFLLGIDEEERRRRIRVRGRLEESEDPDYWIESYYRNLRNN